MNIHHNIAHWNNRIGFLSDTPYDKWWKIDEFTSIDLLINEISDALINKVIPEIKLYFSDESLKKAFLQGKLLGNTKYRASQYLSILLELSGN